MSETAPSVFTQAELEYRLIYSVIVAGKSAKFADAVMKRIFPSEDQAWSPFARLRNLGNYYPSHPEPLYLWMKVWRTGNYNKTARCLREILAARLCLARISPQELEAFHGIGPKTSRFFILWTRPWERYAALDVHILRQMREWGYSAPKSTPTGKKYRELELAFIAEADKRGMTPRELDHQIWMERSKYTGDVQSL